MNINQMLINDVDTKRKEYIRKHGTSRGFPSWFESEVKGGRYDKQ